MKICVYQKKVVLLQRGIVRAWQARAIRVAVWPIKSRWV